MSNNIYESFPPPYNSNTIKTSNNYTVSDDDITKQLELITIAESQLNEFLAIDTITIKNNYINYLLDSRPLVKHYASIIQEYNNMKINYDNERLINNPSDLKLYIDKKIDNIKLSYDTKFLNLQTQFDILYYKESRLKKIYNHFSLFNNYIYLQYRYSINYLSSINITYYINPIHEYNFIETYIHSFALTIIGHIIFDIAFEYIIGKPIPIIQYYKKRRGDVIYC